jgi:hypothetical protein
VNRLIVRSGPGRQYLPVIQPTAPGEELAAVQLDDGQRVTVIGISVDGDWLRVLVPDRSATGWVFNGDSWVQLDGDVELLPVIDAESSDDQPPALDRLPSPDAPAGSRFDGRLRPLVGN